jgi:hypothetical protein
LKNSNEQTLKEVLDSFLKTYKLNEGVYEAQLIKSWEKVAGVYIAKQTEKIFIKKRHLFVKIASPALKNELLFAREKLVKALNDSIDRNVIDEIVFI